MKVLTRIIFLVVFLIVGSAAYSQIPRYISYQGMVEQSGQPLNGTRNAQLTLYADSNGTVNLFQMYSPITFTKGVFEIKIGPIPTGFDFTKPLYLGVSIEGGAELLPRTLLTTSPYSFYAEKSGYADTASRAGTADVLSTNSPDRLPSGAVVIFTDSGSHPGYTYTGSHVTVATESWSKGAVMPVGQYIMTSSVVNGKIYVIGGALGNKNDNQIYDPSTNTWTTGAELPVVKSSMTASLVNGKIYIMGGFGGLDNENQIYDPATNRWTTGAMLPVAEVNMTAAVVNGKIYVMGGDYGSHDYNQIYTPAFELYYFIKN